jgi:hypothetical protein
MATIKLTRVPRSKWPTGFGQSRKEVWHGTKFLVQVFDEAGGTERVSVNRVNILPNGRFADDISWDELQAIKLAIGRGDRFAIEIYPRECDVVDVANMRHLWVLNKPLPIGWENNRLVYTGALDTIEHISKLLAELRFQEVACILQSIDTQSTTPEVLVAILRITYPVRHAFDESWHMALEAVSLEFEARNLDGNTLLRGLEE